MTFLICLSIFFILYGMPDVYFRISDSNCYMYYTNLNSWSVMVLLKLSHVFKKHFHHQRLTDV